MEHILPIIMGLGLAAACGFRLFVPLLVMCIAARTGEIQLAQSAQWIASTPALIVFSTATALEIGAFYLPWIDNLLDTAAAPAAFIAGAIAASACVADISPWLVWVLAAIAGGGLATGMHLVTATARAASTATTAGLANPIVSTAEAAMSTTLSLLAVVLAPAALLLLVGAIGYACWRLSRRRKATLTT